MRKKIKIEQDIPIANSNIILKAGQKVWVEFTEDIIELESKFNSKNVLKDLYYSYLNNPKIMQPYNPATAEIHNFTEQSSNGSLHLKVEEFSEHNKKKL